MLVSAAFTVRPWKNARSFCSMRFQEVTSFPKICNEIMHHLMLSLIVMNEIMEFCVTSLMLDNWEQKYCQTLGNKPNQSHHVLWGGLFSKWKFKLLNSLFHLVYLVFPKSLISIVNLFAVRYLWVVCNEDKCCVVTQLTAIIHVTWLVYLACLHSHVLRAYCNFESVTQKEKSKGICIKGHPISFYSLAFPIDPR